MLLSKLRSAYRLSVRLLLTGLLGGLVLMSNVLPVMAANNPLDEGEATLKGIQQKTEEVKDKLLSRDEVQSRSEGGLNEIQGKSNKEKSIRHASDVEEDNSVTGRVKNIFDNITNPK